MEFGVLGQLEARDEGRELALGGNRQRAVLGVLLLHANKVISSDQLVEAVWGERPPASAPKTLQGYVWGLRKVLGASALVTRPPGYGMRLTEHELDLLRFHRLLAAAQGQEPSAAVPLLREALALWRGQALADVTLHGDAATEIRRLNDLRVVTQADLIEGELELGRASHHIAELEDLVAANPFDERLRRLLVLGLYRVGRQADALKAYAETRKVLVDELGIEPGPELRRLEQAILTQDPVLDAPAPARAPIESAASVRAVSPDSSGRAGRTPASHTRTRRRAQIVREALWVSVGRPIDLGIIALGVVFGLAFSGWVALVAALLYAWRLGATIRAVQNWHSLAWIAVRARSLVRIAPHGDLRTQVRELVSVCVEASRIDAAAARPRGRADRRTLRRLLEQSRDQYNLDRADQLARQIGALDRLGAERSRLQKEADRLDPMLDHIRGELFRARIGSAVHNDLAATLRDHAEAVRSASASLRTALDDASSFESVVHSGPVRRPIA